MPSSKSFKGFFLFFCGMFMGMADLVPGISGGTVAFIMGFYQPLLESLKSIRPDSLELLLKLKFREFSQKVNLPFLLTLVSGVVFSIFSFAHLFYRLFQDEVYRVYLYSLFFGLILASFFFCIRLVQSWSWKELTGVFVGLMIAFLLTGQTLKLNIQGEYAVKIDLQSQTSSVYNYNSENHLLTHLSSTDLSALLRQKVITTSSTLYGEDFSAIGAVGDVVENARWSYFSPYLIFCGSLAICALLLPGISGSYLLTLLGVYPSIIAAISEFTIGLGALQIRWEALSVLMNLGLGIVFGAIVFSKSVSWLLVHYSNITIATLSGFVIGAIKAVWPFWTHIQAVDPTKVHQGVRLYFTEPIWPSGASLVFLGPFFIALFGFSLVFMIDGIAKAKV